MRDLFYTPLAMRVGLRVLGCVFRIPLFCCFSQGFGSLRRCCRRRRCLLLAGIVYGLLDCEQYCVDIVFMYTDDS